MKSLVTEFLNKKQVSLEKKDFTTLVTLMALFQCCPRSLVTPKFTVN